MTKSLFSSPDETRHLFAQAMSDMYRKEVPQYGALLDIVADVNAVALQDNPDLRRQVLHASESIRLDVERHGAIRLGTPLELNTVRRAFRVLGMFPVGYYDLSVAGVPVHATAFRPVDEVSLARNPFRIFTSLLRLDLIEDSALRSQAEEILHRRHIFTGMALELIEEFECAGGLTPIEAEQFVVELLETFRWHGDLPVNKHTYSRLLHAHRLVADVVCFHGPHINHLTPRTLDIDAAQTEMARRGLPVKQEIEGPPHRKFPILLRQTSFRALDERITFAGEGGEASHTARFGEIEQRGLALTPKGRALYDTLLNKAREEEQIQSLLSYQDRLAKCFEEFPDDLDVLRREGLGYFRYELVAGPSEKPARLPAGYSLDALVKANLVRAEPIVYEDFLPVSAAGIFQSNLGGEEQRSFAPSQALASFQQSLGATVLDPFELYAKAEKLSLDRIADWQANSADAAAGAVDEVS